MKTDIADYIRKCESCQRKKLVRIKTKQPMVLTETSIDVFDKVALDIVRPLNILENGDGHILTMQDYSSKFCLATPLENINAEAITKASVDHFITHFGYPRAILTDQGFTSLLMKHIAKLFGIKHIRTTSFVATKF